VAGEIFGRLVPDFIKRLGVWLGSKDDQFGGITYRTELTPEEQQEANQEALMGMVMGMSAGIKGGPPTGKRPTFRPKVKQEILDGDEYCSYCWSKDNGTIDHVDPWSKIKMNAKTRQEEIDIYNDLDDLVRACKTCNSKKQDKTLLVWLLELFRRGQ
jgi:hypothetical protein